MTSVLACISLIICCFGVTIVAALNSRNPNPQVVIGSCKYEHRFNDADDEETEGRSDRAYPFLECSSFNKTSLQNFNFSNTVQGFLLDGSDNISFALEDLHILDELKTIELHQVFKLSEPTQNATPFSEITSLSLTKCNQSTIPTPILRLFPNLVRLNMGRNNVTAVGANDFDFSSKLQSVDLSHNPITSLNTSWLNTTTNIERLILRSINLKDVGDKFRTAKYLKFLDLSDNLLTFLKAKSFRQARSISTLILANNKIKQIERNAFKGPFDLSLIDLTENALSSLEEGVFDFQPSHELTVELWENPINCSDSLIWMKNWIDNEQSYGSYPDVRLKCHNPARNHGKKFMENGKTLSKKELTYRSSDESWKTASSNQRNCPPQNSAAQNTSQNKTTTTPATTATTRPITTTTAPTTKPKPTTRPPKIPLPCPRGCDCFPNPNRLPTHFNARITDFAYPLVICTDSSLTSIPAVPDGTKGLVVMATSLKSVDIGKLTLPSSLTTLVLKKNQISELIAKPNVVFSKIDILGLQDNLITKISKNFLASFPNLSKLSLFNNKITAIADDNFENNKFLKKLLLGPNPMKGKFSGKALSRLDKLVRLQLRGLKMTRVPLSIKNKRELTSVDLSDNVLTRVPRDSFLNCSNINSISLENNNISVIEENAFRHLPNLLHLDLSENKLTTLPEDMLRETLELSHVELWQNPIHCDCHLKPFISWVKQMEHDNPSTEIRFRCEEPYQMRGKTSDETDVDDYTCNPFAVSGDMHKSRLKYTQKDLSVAIVVTILICSLAFIVLQVLLCRCNRFRNHRQGGRSSKYRFSVLSANSGNGQMPIALADDNDAGVL